MTHHSLISLRMAFTALLILSFGGLIFVAFDRLSPNASLSPNATVTDFSSCKSAGFPIMESMPRRCATPDGRVFVEEAPVVAPAEPPLIVVTTPATGAYIANPTTVKGFARGYWYFEASFPIEIRDKNGTLIAAGAAQAETDWMTEQYVPFSTTLVWSAAPTTDTGVIIFRRDNPSGLPENDASVEVPVSFVPLPNNMTRVNVFFSYDPFINNPDAYGIVLPVPRDIPSTTSIARASIETLLQGPTPAESAQRYRTNINPKTVVKSIVIDDSGVATIDLSSERFGENESFTEPGTPAIAYFERQLVETLRQFPSVTSVRYLHDGKEPMWDP
jgi:hypothetical protein